MVAKSPSNIHAVWVSPSVSLDGTYSHVTVTTAMPVGVSPGTSLCAVNATASPHCHPLGPTDPMVSLMSSGFSWLSDGQVTQGGALEPGFHHVGGSSALATMWGSSVLATMWGSSVLPRVLRVCSNWASSAP